MWNWQQQRDQALAQPGQIEGCPWVTIEPYSGTAPASAVWRCIRVYRLSDAP